MRVRFLTELRVEKSPGDGWRLCEPFRVALEEGERVHELEVPRGFETDFASVPRLPLAFLLAGDTAHRAAVLHDFLYASRADRGFADRAFRAAMKAEGVSAWRRWLMFAGVRAFGGMAYENREPLDMRPAEPYL